MSLASDYGLVKHVICVLFLVSNSINSDRPRVDNTQLLPTLRESAKKRWVGKNFTDVTYTNPSGKGLYRPSVR
jgi:hypothetical protein